MKPTAILPILMMMTLPAWAETPAEATADGSSTRQWMSLQKGDAATVPAARPQSGEVGDRVYQRYLESFEHPIPETFEREQFTSGSSSR